MNESPIRRPPPDAQPRDLGSPGPRIPDPADQPSPPARIWSTIRGRLARLRGLGTFAAGVAAALAALLLYRLIVPAPTPLTARDVKGVIVETMASATPRRAFSAQAYQIIQPSLVLIQTEGQDKDGAAFSGLGSGVVINDSGAILTSLHVVTNTSVITLTFADGSQSPATIAAAQPEDDIAVLSPSQLPALLVPATLGNPGALRIGDEVFAVGNPFGLYGSMSEGVVSGFDRSFRPESSQQPLDGLIQIDAAVNPGNSGGPLLNRDGQVVGIVVGIINPTEQEVFIGIGFAVPITVAGGAAGLPSQ